MIWTVATSLLLLLNYVKGHGHMIEPKSRNYRASVDVDWNNCLINGGGCNNPNVPKKEDSPQSMNNNGGTVNSQCGAKQGGSTNYDFPPAWNGQPLNWQSQAVYSQGSIITTKVAITAYHKGFFEFYACPRNQPNTEACFKQYPLTFVQDKLYGAVKDNNYPMRAYASPLAASPMNFEFLMKLPNGLSGDVLIQWIYVTANSFNPPGYTKYPFPWPNGFNNLPEGIGERFWNCAEVTMTGGAPVPAPIPAPVSVPIPAPVSAPVPSPVQKPVSTPTSSGTCGNGNRGNGVCANGQCCSQWGWCGTTSAHCSGGAPPVSTPVAAPVPAPVSSGTCGGGNRGNGICSNGQCCSQWGWCGTTSDFCVGSVTKLGDWSVCTWSSQCSSNCCSGKYSGGVLKCTPLGSGFNPSLNGCVNRRLINLNNATASNDNIDPA